MKPSTSIEAAAHGLKWKVEVNGKTVATGAARNMQEAQAEANDYITKMPQD
jgi:hypothetical protein